MAKNYRVGLIVPSSNTTMETEIPAMLNSRINEFPDETFTFHSSRMRMKHVSKEELSEMDKDSDRCAVELSDARCDVLAYACLVAIMCQGAGYHKASEERLHAATAENGGGAPVISSAGALVDCLKIMNAKRVSIITPYMKPLTQMVVDYIEQSGIEVIDSISLEVADNLEVGRLNPDNLPEIAKKLNIEGADAVVLSACVQMPSLPAIQKAEDQLGLPVLSAGTATVYKILKQLELETKVPNAGSLLSGKY
ncbi:Asp/Glu racemase [Peribacillus saganii]|uniref:Maleate isomerase n=1 Tax=Peribacillus saganii TaxID=2303992 RepID=A0A372LQI7_9BACI|nr:aspartate/glutamate racemase family protein [Peribacillus saganii]RFU70493.1 Asp/Glu racemase [Peribacillus saganii]